MTNQTPPTSDPRVRPSWGPYRALSIGYRRVEVPRWSILLALGAVSLMVYWIGLVRPYSLWALRFRPLVDIAGLTRGRPLAQASFVMTIAALFGLYYLAWRTCRPGKWTTKSAPADGSVEAIPGPSRTSSQRGMWLVLAASVLAVNLCMLWMYPIGAADLFDNIVRGRLTARYAGNPFFDPPRSIRQDPFFAYSAWRDWPSAYGPAWELLAAGTSRLAGNGILGNVIAFKVVGLALFGGSIFLLAAILRKRAPDRTLQGVCLFACNPLVVYETAGNGHNDIVMVFFILLAFFALQRGRTVLAGAGLTVGALVKFIPLLLLPLVAVIGLKAVSSGRARGLFLLKLGAVCVALTALAYAPFRRGGDLLGMQRRERLFSTSLPAMFETRLEGTLGVRESRRVVSRAALALTGLMVLAQMVRVWRDQPRPRNVDLSESWLTPVRASSAVLIFYLIVTCLWFQPWYAIWPLALASLLPEGELGRTGVLLSYVAAWKTIFFSFILVPGSHLPTRLWRETRLAPAILGVVWLYAVYGMLRARRLRWPWMHRGRRA